MLEEIREGYLSKKVRAKFSRAHNYLVRRYLLLRFGMIMYCDFSFAKSYYSFSLK